MQHAYIYLISRGLLSSISNNSRFAFIETYIIYSKNQFKSPSKVEHINHLLLDINLLETQIIGHSALQCYGHEV